MFKGIKKVVGVLLVMASLLVPSVAFAAETPTVTIVGDPLVGETLEAVFSGVDGTETYQWAQYINNYWTSLEGGNTSKYKFTSNMRGNRIQCEVTHNGSTYYAYVDRINIRELSVKITGTPNVGEVLVAEVEPADATVLYQWYRTNEYSPISGATASTYQLTEEDRKKQIGVTVTGIENYAGASAGIKFDSSIGEALGTDIVTPWHEDSQYGKSVYTGDTLSAVTDGIDVAGYEWQRLYVWNGTTWWRTMTTEPTYTVGSRTGNGGWQNEQGATSAIRLVITDTAGVKHYSYKLTCLDGSNPHITEDKILPITGEPVIGGNLEAVFTDGDGSESYQWYATIYRKTGYRDVTLEETSSSYVVEGDIEIGDEIWCVVTYAGKTYTTDKMVIQEGEPSGGDNSGETGGKIEDSLSDVEYATASNATQKDVLVVASQSSTFTVTIPKRITLDGTNGTADYEVTVQGDITGEEVITVIPSKTFEMISAGKKAIIATVTQMKEAFSVALDTMEGLMKGVVTTGRVEVENLTAGEWEGICTFTIKID